MGFTIRRRLFAVGLALIMALVLIGHSQATSAQSAGGRLRFVHGVPAAPAIDITVDNVLAASNLAYSSATRYLNVAAGDHAISVVATGTTNVIFTGKVTSAAGQAQTIVLQGTLTAVELGAYEDDLGPVAAGNTRMTAINVLKDGPAVDVLKGDGSPLIQGLKYGTPYGGFDIPAVATALNVMPTGGGASAILKVDSVSLAGGTHNTLVILGTVSGSVKPSYVLLTAPTDANDPATNIQLRFVNASPEAQSVDVYAGDKLIVPALTFGAATPHIALDVNAGQLSVRAAGSPASSSPLGALTTTLSVKAATIVIASAGGGIALEPSNDDVSTLDPKTARVNVINGTGTVGADGTLKAGNASIKLGSATTLTGNAPALNVKATEVPAGIYDDTVTVDNPAIQITDKLALSGGVLYDLVITGNGQTSLLIVAATGLNEQPGSVPALAGNSVAQADTPAAPGTEAAPATEQAQPTVVAAAPTATLAPTDTVVAPTDVPPTDVQPTTSSEVVDNTPTSEPDVVDATATNPPVAAPQGTTATVITREGVNLKIREYPRTDARTLALLPSGSTLDVQGVIDVRSPTPTGQPTVAVTSTAGPTPTIPSKDLDTATLWLFINWSVPDGGTVTGWVNADPTYLQVTRDGKDIKTAADMLTLRLIPASQPGEFNTTSVTPIAEANQILATVDQINDGTNLQMRRTPGIDGESLALIPAKAQAVVLQQTVVKSKGGVVGEPSSTTWYFVRYSTDSGSVTGWINAEFVTITKNGRKLTDDDLKKIPVAQTIQRGFTEGNAQVVTPPPPAGIIATVDKINQGSNLQLRRDPNSDAESLGLIPAGSELQVQGRNGDGNWLEVSIQGQTGWINSQFVTLTKSGKAYKIDDLTIVNGDKNKIGTVTPGPSPTATVNATVTPAG